MMGQYYRPLLISKDGAKRSALAHTFDNGLKLMEHSWVGNNFVNAVLHEMVNKPTRLAWLGDYSDSAVEEECNLGGGYITSVSEFLKMFNYLWGEDCAPNDLPGDSPTFKLDREHADCYIVNLTKRCYIDMEQYVKRNIHKPPYDDHEWCVHPLPLLTALGNGMGGGDYRGEEGKDNIGSWAFDEIYVTYLRPGTMEAVEFCFKE